MECWVDITRLTIFVLSCLVSCFVIGSLYSFPTIVERPAIYNVPKLVMTAQELCTDICIGLLFHMQQCCRLQSQ